MKLYAKWFYGFYPETAPIITFSTEGGRDSLLRKSNPGDRMVFIASNSDETPPELRSKLLGMAEIGYTRVRSTDILTNINTLAPHNFDKGGNYRWPEAIPMVRAWRFNDQPFWKDVLMENWKRNVAPAQRYAVLLSEEEKNAIMGLASSEVDIPLTAQTISIRETNDALSKFPKDWGFEVDRIASNIKKTVKNNNGQEVTTNLKDKKLLMSDSYLHEFLRKMLIKQDFRCKITGQKLKIGDPWLNPSPDRIDSNKHYSTDNIQITSWAANRAKGNVPIEEIENFFAALQQNIENED